MRLRLINPNTTQAMTDAIGRTAAAVVGPGTRVEALGPSMGPASIESHYEEALAVPGVLELVRDGERDGVDATVLACFGDPGLDAARELATGPVLGIAEAGMHAASMVGRGFGIVTTLGRTVGRSRELVQRYGFADRCVDVRACEVSVLGLDDPSSDARALIVDECHEVLASGADAVLLGCAGMTDLCRSISDEIGAPVVDGVAAATVFAESLVRLGLVTGKRGEYARPPLKEITGLLSPFALGGAPALL